MELTQNQLDAINSDDNHILVVAGAGAGKTKVLTERISRLLKDNKCKSGNILCLTFTRNSGKEMKERISKLIGIKECKDIFCNTFHAFCISILKEWGYKIGYFDNFSIYNENEKISLIKNIIVDLCIVSKEEDIKTKDIKNVLLCLKHPEYTKMDYPKLSKYISAAEEYKFRLRKNSAVDLDMLLIETVRVLKDKEVNEYYHNKFTYCFIDEFQDSNDIQLDIIREINPLNIFNVGDIDQSIYRWRGANPKNMLNFAAEYPDAKIIKLEDNFRSTQAIVTAANNLIKNNKQRFDKKLISHKDGPKVDILRFKNSEVEAEKIGKFIKVGRKRIGDYNFGDFAILARTNSMLKVVSNKFKELGIPFNIPTREDIFNRKDIQEILNFIESAVNSGNDMAVKKAVNFPVRILGPEQIAKVELKCLENDISFHEALGTFQFKDQNKINEYLNKIGSIEQFILSNSNNALDVFKHAVDVLKLNYISKLEDVYSKIDSWCKVQQESFNESDSIEYFLKWIKTRDHLDIEDSEDKDDNYVKLMTIHAAKGLEFPIVFVIGMMQGIFPNKKSTLEDERNLAYVALTRPQIKLYLSSTANISYGNGYTSKAQASVFLSEIAN